MNHGFGSSRLCLTGDVTTTPVAIQMVAFRSAKGDFEGFSRTLREIFPEGRFQLFRGKTRDENTKPVSRDAQALRSEALSCRERSAAQSLRVAANATLHGRIKMRHESVNSSHSSENVFTSNGSQSVRSLTVKDLQWSRFDFDPSLTSNNASET